MKHNKPLLYDRTIIKRVKLYLEQNVEETNVNVGSMTRKLMSLYPEYSRRKFGPFCKLVLEAFHIVSKSYGIDQEALTSTTLSGTNVKESEPVAPKPKPNPMSGMMNSLYNKPKNVGPTPPTAAAKTAQESVDILISSDDDDDNATATPTANGKAPKRAATADEAHGPQKRGPPSILELVEQRQKRLKSDNNTTSVPNMRTGHEHKQIMDDSEAYNDDFDDGASIASDMSPRRHGLRNYKKKVNIRKAEHKFEDIGGMENTLKELCELLINIKSPDIYFQLGLLPPRGILLYGPTGCGKNFLAEAIAGQLHLPFIEVAATELIAGVSGESEERIRDIFDQATNCSPCVLFIDEIDTISSNRLLAQKDMERRVVSQLISCMDELKTSDSGQSVLVIGATSRPDVLDPALRRFGRFDHEIPISIPSRKGRKEILKILSRGLSIDKVIDYDKIAELTPGYVGADLFALIIRGAAIAVKRKCTQNFRTLEAKAQRMMDIVNLDDDDTETPEKNAEKNTAQQATPEKKTTDKETTEKTSDKKKVKDAGDGKDDSKKDESNKMETDDEPKDVEGAKDVKEQITTSSNTESDAALSEDVHEPTLTMLTNWLENPPDEFNDPEFCITMADFLAAVKVVQPAAKREGFITVPDVTWDDIGSLHEIRDELKLAVLAPVKYPEKLERLGLTSPSGVLLCGPPGCGKTLLAKAVANEAGINFISVKGPELMNMYVGESERAVRACFQRARNSAPCVIFFDEFDSLCPKRSNSNEAGSGTRIVNQLLTEMDGVEERKGVYILAATNRPDIIDPAILRPGRLDTILYVGLPEEQERAEILQANTKNGTCPKLAADVEFSDLAAKTDGYTGADLAGLVKQASMLALRDSLKDSEQELDDLCVRKKDFDAAILLLRPSVTEQDRKVYEKLRLKYAAPRVPVLNTDK